MQKGLARSRGYASPPRQVSYLHTFPSGHDVCHPDPPPPPFADLGRPDIAFCKWKQLYKEAEGGGGEYATFLGNKMNQIIHSHMWWLHAVTVGGHNGAGERKHNISMNQIKISFPYTITVNNHNEGRAEGWLLMWRHHLHTCTHAGIKSTKGPYKKGISIAFTTVLKWLHGVVNMYKCLRGILNQKCQSQDQKNGFDDVERVGMLNQLV